MKLEEIINKAESLCSRLECDGTTRVLDYLLTENKIEHTVKLGIVEMGKENIPFHWWIELPDKRIIDLKAKMWMKNKKAPHGIFKKKDTEAIYTGKMEIMNTSKLIYEILTKS